MRISGNPLMRYSSIPLKTLDALKFSEAHCIFWPRASALDVVFGKAHTSHRFLEKKNQSDTGSTPSDHSERCSQTKGHENTVETPDNTSYTVTIMFVFSGDESQ